MTIIFFNVRVAACVVGGLLFLVTNCNQPQPAEPLPVLEAETQAEPTVTEQQPSLPASVTPTVVMRQSATPLASPTPFAEAMPIPTPKYGPYTFHTISPGETLSYISLLYGTDIEEIVALNDLAGPTAIIQIDQALRVPIQTDNVSPDEILLPDSEVVYGPAYADFDIAQFINDQGGFLASYQENVDGQLLNGPEVVERVAEQFSVGPRLLLTLLEHYGGWVTSPTLTEQQINLPLGPRNPRGGSLYQAMAFTANRINAGYYGYKRDGFWVFHLPDGSQAVTPQGLNAGTVGVQNILAIHSDWDTWQQELKPDGFMALYRTLFDDPFSYNVGPPLPVDLTQPPLSLPWRPGQGFYFTSGPHAGYVDGSAWAAVDFGPPDVLGSCFYSNEPVTAAAGGVIVVARNGEVYLDLDGDGKIQTGWVLFYLHAAADSETPVYVGQQVEQGDVIGYPSCEGGLSNSSHLHFARRYNGEWLAAGGPAPMNLSGWVVQPNLAPYQGTIANGLEVREACECWEPDLNLIVNTDKN